MSVLLALLAAATQAPPAVPPVKQDPVVCKRLNTTLTGSNFKQWEKVCKKKSVWTAESDAMFESVRRVRDQGSGNPEEGLTPGYCAPGAAC